MVFDLIILFQICKICQIQSSPNFLLLKDNIFPVNEFQSVPQILLIYLSDCIYWIVLFDNWQTEVGCWAPIEFRSVALSEKSLKEWGSLSLKESWTKWQSLRLILSITFDIFKEGAVMVPCLEMDNNTDNFSLERGDFFNNCFRSLDQNLW